MIKEIFSCVHHKSVTFDDKLIYIVSGQTDVNTFDIRLLLRCDKMQLTLYDAGKSALIDGDCRITSHETRYTKL